MTQYLFGEEILREDRRRGTYFVRYLPWLIIFAALAVLPWVLPYFIHLYFIPLNNLYFQIIASIVFLIIFVIILIIAIVNWKRTRLILTIKRVCFVKGFFNGYKKYFEARFDKIDSLEIRRRTLAVYAGGRKVFSFGPLADPFITREALIVLVEKRYAEESDDSSAQTKPVSCSEAEPISKSGDVFGN